MSSKQRKINYCFVINSWLGINTALRVIKSHRIYFVEIVVAHITSHVFGTNRKCLEPTDFLVNIVPKQSEAGMYHWL